MDMVVMGLEDFCGVEEGNSSGQNIMSGLDIERLFDFCVWSTEEVEQYERW